MAPSSDRLRDALEQALVDDPDDLAATMAYADWLSEQLDPALRDRGELVRVQLELEDISLSDAAKARLQRREQQLLKKHQRDWLGPDLARYVLDQDTEDLVVLTGYDLTTRAGFAYRRGWVTTLRFVLPSVAAVRHLASSPALHLLRELWIDGTPEPGVAAALGRAKNLGNVRTLYLLDESGEIHGRIDPMLKAFPRLEALRIEARSAELGRLFSLSSLTALRALVLRNVDCHGLRLLGDNPALGRLERLEVYPPGISYDDEPLIGLADVRAIVHSPHLKSLKYLVLQRGGFGDKGVAEIVRSGILRRLQELDVSHGCITDKGARALAGCKDLKRLGRLAIEDNRLTDAGISRLARACEWVYAAGQNEPDDDGRFLDRYLYDDDWE